MQHLTQFMEKNVHSSEFRSHIILCLAMLHSTNYKAGTKLAIILDVSSIFSLLRICDSWIKISGIHYNSLQDQLKQIDSENLMVVGMEAVVDECMLMLTLASHHPALSFEKKLSFKTKLMDYEKILHRKQMQVPFCCISWIQWDSLLTLMVRSRPLRFPTNQNDKSWG